MSLTTNDDDDDGGGCCCCCCCWTSARFDFDWLVARLRLKLGASTHSDAVALARYTGRHVGSKMKTKGKEDERNEQGEARDKWRRKREERKSLFRLWEKHDCAALPYTFTCIFLYLLSTWVQQHTYTHVQPICVSISYPILATYAHTGLVCVVYTRPLFGIEAAAAAASNGSIFKIIKVENKPG